MKSAVKLSRHDISRLCAGLVCGAAASGLTFALYRMSGWLSICMGIVTAAVLGICGFFFMKERNRRYRITAFIFSTLLMLTFLLGRRYLPDLGGTYSEGATAGGVWDWVMMIACSLLAAPGLAAPVLLAFDVLANTKARAVTGSVRRFGLIVWACLIVCWVPVWLAYWPGLLEYDSGGQLWQTWNRLYNTANPLPHTLVLGFFYTTFEKISTCTDGIAAFCGCQLLLVSGCLARSLAILKKHGAPMLPLIILTVFFGLMPVFPMMAISCTKDVPFYALIILQMMLSFDLYRAGDTKRIFPWVRLGLVMLAASLMRSNALIPMIPAIPFIFWCCREKALRRRLILFCAAGVACAIGVNAVLTAVLNASPTPPREALSVPAVQISRTEKYHPEFRETVEADEHIDTTNYYVYHLADHSKWVIDEKAGFGDIFDTWLAGLRAYPQDYVDAFLLLNEGYWYLADTSFAKVYGGLGVLPSRDSAIETVESCSLLPSLKALYERLYTNNEYL